MSAALKLFESLGIVCVPIEKSRKRGPLETCAARIAEKVVADHGIEHATLVLRCITETSPANALQLTRPIILAVSDVLSAHQRFADSGLALLEAFDSIDLGLLWKTAKRAKVTPRQAVAMLIFAELEKLLGPAVPPKLPKVKREPKPPKTLLRIAMNEDYIKVGLDLIEMREALAHNASFAHAVRRQFDDLDPRTAAEYMRVARAYSDKPAIYTKMSWQALLALSSPSMPDAVREAWKRKSSPGSASLSRRSNAPEVARSGLAGRQQLGA
jgi:hypothetical protein